MASHKYCIVADRNGFHRLLGFHENMGIRAIEGRCSGDDKIVDDNIEDIEEAQRRVDNLNAVREVLTS